MRSISEIKQEIADEFMSNEAVANVYRFEVGSSFEKVFSALSVESVLMYVFAVCAWSVERLMAEHKMEVESRLTNSKAHRPKWYRDKVLAFMVGEALQGDSDEYDTAGMSDDEIEKLRVVKHAVAVENDDESILIIKVAGEKEGKRQPLSYEEAEQLRAYIGEIKDAGVRVSLVNQEADVFNCEVDVYYDAMLGQNTVEQACRGSIKRYIENLPFNGEYTNMALVDSLQGVDGVRIAELKRSTAQAVGETESRQINARTRPVAGYFKEGEITLKMVPYEKREV